MSVTSARPVRPASPRRCGGRNRSASSESSTAMTRASGQNFASATASAPEPVHRSTMHRHVAASGCADAHSSSDSVSGRGMNTPGPTETSPDRTGRTPIEVLQRDPRARGGDQIPVAVRRTRRRHRRAPTAGRGRHRRRARPASRRRPAREPTTRIGRARAARARWLASHVAARIALMPAAAGTACRRRPARRTARRGRRRGPGRGCAP